MIASQPMDVHILCIAGPTGSGKSARAIDEALSRNGEIISVDSRQVYRGLDIGTEKILLAQRRGIPHHLIDILDARESYSAGDFVIDATRLIDEIRTRGRLPILAGGTHFYFDALLRGLPEATPANANLRAELETVPMEELYARIQRTDARRAGELDPHNRRRLIRALEIIAYRGNVPEREKGVVSHLHPEWIIIDPPHEELRTKIDMRLARALQRGLIDEVRRVRKDVGDIRLEDLGLEYRIVGEYLRGERPEESVFPALSAKLWQYARRQKAWLTKLSHEVIGASL